MSQVEDRQSAARVLLCRWLWDYVGGTGSPPDFAGTLPQQLARDSVLKPLRFMVEFCGNLVKSHRVPSVVKHLESSESFADVLRLMGMYRTVSMRRGEDAHLLLTQFPAGCAVLEAMGFERSDTNYVLDYHTEDMGMVVAVCQAAELLHVEARGEVLDHGSQGGEGKSVDSERQSSPVPMEDTAPVPDYDVTAIRDTLTALMKEGIPAYANELRALYRNEGKSQSSAEQPSSGKPDDMSDEADPSVQYPTLFAVRSDKKEQEREQKMLARMMPGYHRSEPTPPSKPSQDAHKPTGIIQDASPPYPLLDLSSGDLKPYHPLHRALKLMQLLGVVASNIHKTQGKVARFTALHRYRNGAMSMVGGYLADFPSLSSFLAQIGFVAVPDCSKCHGEHPCFQLSPPPSENDGERVPVAWYHPRLYDRAISLVARMVKQYTPDIHQLRVTAFGPVKRSVSLQHPPTSHPSPTRAPSHQQGARSTPEDDGEEDDRKAELRLIRESVRQRQSSEYHRLLKMSERFVVSRQMLDKARDDARQRYARVNIRVAIGTHVEKLGGQLVWTGCFSPLETVGTVAALLERSLIPALRCVGQGGRTDNDEDDKGNGGGLVDLPGITNVPWICHNPNATPPRSRMHKKTAALNPRGLRSHGGSPGATYVLVNPPLLRLCPLADADRRLEELAPAAQLRLVLTTLGTERLAKAHAQDDSLLHAGLSSQQESTLLRTAGLSQAPVESKSDREEDTQVLRFPAYTMVRPDLFAHTVQWRVAELPAAINAAPDPTSSDTTRGTTSGSGGLGRSRLTAKTGRTTQRGTGRTSRLLAGGGSKRSSAKKRMTASRLLGLGRRRK